MPPRARTLVVGCAATLLFGGCSSADSTPQSPVVSSASTVSAPDTTRTSLQSTSTSPTTAPEVTPAPPTTAAPPLDTVEGIASLLADLTLRDQFSGVVLIARGDDVVFEFANGLADRESNVPIDMDSKFNLGSMSKMFTAVAILQLAEQQMLALDGTIALYLPDYPNTGVAGQVTIEQLLTHTSGLGDTFTARFEANPNQFRSNADYLPLFADEPLQFTPGEQFLYSNAGYAVLGLIIEQVSGQSYLDYVRSNIFEPSGMANTDSYDIEDDIPDLAIGYTTQDIHGNQTGVLAANTPLMPGRGFAAGGGYSTAGDLLRFRNALLSHQLLSPVSLDLLITGRVQVGEQARYALGFFDRVQAGQRVVGHGGGAPGVCSSLGMYPETGHTVVVLSNSDSDCLAVLDHLKDNPLQ